MKKPGVETTKEQANGGEAPGVEQATKKKFPLGKILAGVAGVGVLAFALSQCDGDQAPPPQQPRENTTPQAPTQERGTYIYRYTLTEDAPIRGPGANDPVLATIKKGSCTESVLGPDNGLSRSGNLIEINATKANGVDQVRGYMDNQFLRNSGIRHQQSGPCAAEFVAAGAAPASTPAPAPEIQTGGSTQILRVRGSANLFTTPDATQRSNFVTEGACIAPTGRSAAGRIEVTVNTGDQEQTFWTTGRFTNSTAPVCQAKLGM